MDDHLVTLCREYILYVDSMTGGQYSFEEIRYFDSQRQLMHYELCRYTKQDRTVNMYQYAKDVHYDAQAKGHYE